MIYVLYGQPASGKTTLGKLLAEHLEIQFVIDGDEFREMIANKNYTEHGRIENIKNANAVATYLNKKNKNVVIALVNPYQDLRQELKNNNQDGCIEILLKSNRNLRKDYHVEDFEQGEPDHIILTDEPVKDTWKKLKIILDIN